MQHCIANPVIKMRRTYTTISHLKFLILRRYTGLFISPSGISELDYATPKTDAAESSISIGRESLQVFLYWGPWHTSRFHR